MNPIDIQDALIALAKPVAQQRDLNPVLPGETYDDYPAPAVVFEYNPAGRPNVTLKGGEIVREDGVFSASLVIARGPDREGNGPAKVGYDHANALAAVYAVGASSAITGGKVFVAQPPEIRGGFPDGAHWRVPVVIRYVAEG